MKIMNFNWTIRNSCTNYFSHLDSCGISKENILKLHMRKKDNEDVKDVLDRYGHKYEVMLDLNPTVGIHWTRIEYV